MEKVYDSKIKRVVINLADNSKNMSSNSKEWNFMNLKQLPLCNEINRTLDNN